MIKSSSCSLVSVIFLISTLSWMPMVKVWSVCVFWMRYSWILMRWDHFREDFLHPKKLQMDFMTIVTVKFTKPWTREIFMECYCVARNKPIRREITKTANSNGSLFCGFEVCSLTEVYCDWPVPNQHVSWNFEGVHGFLSLTVNVCVFPVSGCWKFFFLIPYHFHCLNTVCTYRCLTSSFLSSVPLRAYHPEKWHRVQRRYVCR